MERNINNDDRKGTLIDEEQQAERCLSLLAPFFFKTIWSIIVESLKINKCQLFIFNVS